LFAVAAAALLSLIDRSRRAAYDAGLRTSHGNPADVKPFARSMATWIRSTPTWPGRKRPAFDARLFLQHQQAKLAL